jgi:hypothetical protein
LIPSTLLLSTTTEHLAEDPAKSALLLPTTTTTAAEDRTEPATSASTESTTNRTCRSTLVVATHQRRSSTRERIAKHRLPAAKALHCSIDPSPGR